VAHRCVFVARGVVALRFIGVWWVPSYIVLGIGVWLATYESGIHATIAGVALGLLAPAQAQAASSLEEASPGNEEAPDPSTVQSISARARASISVVERLEHALHPWASYLIVPTFALANAGIALGRGVVTAAIGSSIIGGAVVGLVVGKLSGIFGSAWLAHPLGFATLQKA
jgi:NhaA family Na+:H+ antiporter